MKFREALAALAIAAGVVTVSVGAVTAAVPSPTPGSLQGYNISATYVAGVSSGGYLANQLHVAYSSTIKGAGIFAAGPYDCAQNSISTALTSCMQATVPGKSPAQLEQETRDRANGGTVDPVSGLSGSKVYLYHGTSDTTVSASVNDNLATYYRDLGANVVYNNTTAAGHSWVSPLGPVACSTTASPYINNCDNDPEHDMLAQFLGNVNASSGSALSGKLIQFDQGHYTGGSAGSISMDDKGFAYVPAACASGTSCTLLISLHGCKTGYSYTDSTTGGPAYGDTFMKDANLNEYADTNNIVVLYPQAVTSGSNPQGCWDWWGYTNSSYAEHGGPQMKAIMGMVSALTSSTPPTTTPPTTTTTVPPTTTPAPTCITDNNYRQTVAGRAHQQLGKTYANGSNQDLGLWNTYNTSTIKETSPGYWEKC